MTKRRRQLLEDVVRGSKKLRVDRDKGIIYGCKILGLDSANGRRYLPAAIKAALPLYEGKSVYRNHPAKPNDPRKDEELFGWFENVHQDDDDCAYGDLHILLPLSEAAQRVFAVAEKKPDLLGFSHNAQGDVEHRDGVDVIKEITEVRSVDLVTEPATTGGLFEERRTVAIKIKKLFEAAWEKGVKARTTKRPKLQARMKHLVEDDGMDVMDDDAGVEEVPADHEEALKSGFEASVSAIVSKCLDGEEEPAECIKKIAELLKAHDKLTGGDDEAEEDMEEEEDEDKEDEDKKEMEQLRRKDRARDLCEDMGLPCDKVLLETLMHLPTDAAMRRFLEREKGKGGTGKGKPPRSGVPGSGKELTEAQKQGLDSNEGFLAALLG